MGGTTLRLGLDGPNDTSMELCTLEWPDAAGEVDVGISAELANGSDRTLYLETNVRLLEGRRFLRDLTNLKQGDTASIKDGWDTFNLTVTRNATGHAHVSARLNWGSVSDDQKVVCAISYYADEGRLAVMADQVGSWFN